MRIRRMLALTAKVHIICELRWYHVKASLDDAFFILGGKIMNLYEELEWRGLIKDSSSPKIKDLLNNESITFYIGTDPTGDSLHIGHYSSYLSI